MITLFGFGPAFGLPDPSPFVMKTEVQLKMAGLAYKWERGGPQASPKGKIPFIDDDGLVIADSTFIRAHIEKCFDFDSGLCTVERSLAWAMERMLEDHLYFASDYFELLYEFAEYLIEAGCAGLLEYFDGPFRSDQRLVVGADQNLCSLAQSILYQGLR